MVIPASCIWERDHRRAAGRLIPRPARSVWTCDGSGPARGLPYKGNADALHAVEPLLQWFPVCWPRLRPFRRRYSEPSSNVARLAGWQRHNGLSERFDKRILCLSVLRKIGLIPS